MSVQSTGQCLERVQIASPSEMVWMFAVLLFGVGDLVTTLFLIHSGVAVESHPLAAMVFDQVGVWIAVPWKVVAIALFYGLYTVVPGRIAIGVPIGLALLGGCVTIWNTYIGLIGFGIL